MQDCIEQNGKQNKNLEKKFAITIAKVIKEATGKGPTNCKSYLLKDLFVLKIRGFLWDGEGLLVKTEQGINIVKQYRLELIKVMGQKMKKEIKSLIYIEPVNLFFDLNVESDEGIIVFTFNEDLQKFTKTM